MDYLTSTKATAMNKERARVWLESDKLAAYGFTRGARIDIKILEGAICVFLNSDGARKVAGRNRKGRDIQILDICMPLEQREQLRKGAAKFSVHIQPGYIQIEALQS